jgi:hypothetical protein
MKRFKEYTDESINEAKFIRLPKDLNAMWNLKNSVEYLVGKYDNGDDYNPAEMKTIEEFIKEIKKSAKTFKSKDDVDGTVYESVNEAKKPIIVVYKGRRLAVEPGDLKRLKLGKDIVGMSSKYPGQEEWILAKGQWKVEESVNEAKIAFINNGLISERIQKSGLLPLLGENNVSLNKDKMDFTKELSSTLVKLYKKYSSLPVK